MGVRPENALVSSGILPIFLNALVPTGQDREVCRAFGLPDNWREHDALTLPLSSFWKLCDEVAARSGEPEFGVRVALAADRGAYGLLEYIARTASTLGEAIGQVVRYSGLANELARYAISAEGAEAIYDYFIPGQPLCLGRHANEFGLVFTLRVASEMAGRKVVPRRAWFAHPEPDHRQLLEEAIGAPVEFGVGHNGCALDAEVLGWDVRSADPALRELLRRQVEKALATRPSGDDFPALVRHEILLELPKGGGSAEAVAAALHMSGRTLQRRLAKLGTTFETLLEEARKSQARAYLQDPSIGIREIAYLLGYSDGTAFARAFKRWTGQSPMEVRSGSRSA